MRAQIHIKTGIIFCLLTFFVQDQFAQTAPATERHTIHGHVTDASNGEALIGVVINESDGKYGTTTNVYGFYSLSLPAGAKDIIYRYLGYKSDTVKIRLSGDTIINMDLFPGNDQLNEVLVTAPAKPKELKSALSSSGSLDISQLEYLPSIGGEVDVLKILQLMPGVKQGAEGDAGMYVRGGNIDQNLIILDEATVYNPSHLFGFFSVFNADALSNVRLIKSGFPSNYGGRLSSVLDIRMKEGNLKKFETKGGIGLLAAKITTQGPVIKDKMSFIFSARRTHIDQVFKTLMKDDPLPYFFYDFNGKINYKISDKDRIFLSSYYGNDYLRFKANVGDALFGFNLGFGNLTSTLRWNHVYGKKLFSNISLIHTRFRYDITGKFTGNSILVKSSIRDLGIKADYEFFPNPEHSVRFGLSLVNHIFRPNVISTAGNISELYESRKIEPTTTQEFALYVLDDYKINRYTGINYGFRFSGAMVQEKIHKGLEPRLSVYHNINERNLITASYSRMRQYMHLISSSSIALPVDLWYPVTRRIAPQVSDEVSVGYERTLKKMNTSLTFETYYKKMSNLVAYREGAVLLLNDNYEDELINGNGEAYGFEVMIQKKAGTFNGWLSYNLSWARRQFDQLNNGNPFYAKYDRRHAVSLVGSYRINDRISVAADWVLSSGIWFTPVTAQFLMPNAALTNVDILPVYSDKHSVKFPLTHRLDANIVIKGKPGKKFQSEWNIGGYNLYNRAQPFYSEITEDKNGKVRYEVKGLFGFIPSVRYNFKF